MEDRVLCKVALALEKARKEEYDKGDYSYSNACVGDCLDARLQL